MKNLIYFISFITCYTAWGQTTFVIDNINGPDISAFCDVQYFENKYYFLGLHTEFPDSQRNFGDLWIFDESGQQEDYYQLGDFGYQYFKVLEILPDRIKLIGSIETDSCNALLVMSWFFPATGTLEHLTSLSICPEDRVIKRITVIPGFDGKVFFEGAYGRRITNNVDHISFLVTLDSSDHFKYIFDRLEFSRTHLSVDHSRKAYVLKDTRICDFFDKDFNFRKRRTNFTQRYYSSPFAYSHPFGNKYLLDQAELHYDHGAGQAIRLVDSNLIVRKEVLIAPVPDNARPVSLPMFGGIDVVNDSRAWAACNYGNEAFIGYPYYTITKVDDELNILCQQYLGFDAFYEINGLKAIENNGVVLYGWRKPLEENSFSELQEVYAIKIGENCEITTSSKEASKITYTISAYPNPSINSLTFEVKGFDPSTLAVEIFNPEGITVFSQKDLSYEIHVADLPAGQYFYRILDKEKILGVGSWVKQ